MEKCKRNCVDANKGKVKFNDMKDHETQWDQGVRKGFGQVSEEVDGGQTGGAAGVSQYTDGLRSRDEEGKKDKRRMKTWSKEVWDLRCRIKGGGTYGGDKKKSFSK